MLIAIIEIAVNETEIKRMKLMHSFTHSFCNTRGNAMLRAKIDPEMFSKYSEKFALGGKILIFELTWRICKNKLWRNFHE